MAKSLKGLKSRRRTMRKLPLTLGCRDEKTSETFHSLPLDKLLIFSLSSTMHEGPAFIPTYEWERPTRVYSPGLCGVVFPLLRNVD